MASSSSNTSIRSSSSVEKQPRTKHINTEEEEWYYYGPNNSLRKKFLFCGDCSYKSHNRYVLMAHVQTEHPTSDTALLSMEDDKVKQPTTGTFKVLGEHSKPELGKESPHSVRLECPSCEYRAKQLTYMERHKAHHQIKSDYKCPLCTYSVNEQKQIIYHLKHHHSGKIRDRYLSQSPDKIGKSHSGKEKDTHPSQSIDKTGEWYCSESSSRIKMTFCNDCDFKTPNREQLIRHMQNFHLAEEIVAHPPSPKRKRSVAHYEEYSDESDFEPPPPICQEKEVTSTSSFMDMNDDMDSRKKRPYHQSPPLLDKTTILPEARSHYMEKKLESRTVPVRKDVNETFKCLECDFSTNTSDNLSAHYTTHTNKIKAKCHICSFSTDKKNALTFHLKQHHTNSESLPPAPPQPLYSCTLCDYSTDHCGNMKVHEQGHQRNQRFRCDRCNYSSNLKNTLTVHLKLHHRNPVNKQMMDTTIEPRLPSTHSQEDEMWDSVRNSIAEQLEVFSVSNPPPHLSSSIEPECEMINVETPPLAPSRTLDDTTSDGFKVRKEIVRLEAAIQSDHRYLEELKKKMESRFVPRLDENIQLLVDQLEANKSKAQIAEQELKNLSCQKEEVRKLIKETMKRKMKAEFTLRSMQCETLELNLNVLESIETEIDLDEIAQASERSNFKDLEDDVKGIENELAALIEKEKKIIKDLRNAEESCNRVHQSMSILQSKLDGIKSAQRNEEERMDRLMDSSIVKICKYYELECRLLKSTFIKKRNQVNQKQGNWLDLLRKEFSDNDYDDKVLPANSSLLFNLLLTR